VSTNLAVIAGSCSSPPAVRVLPSGRALAVLQVTTRPDPDGPARSVPVACWDPPAWVEAIEEGTEIVVLGTVRRRFWRAPGSGPGSAPGSRVEVEAAAIAPARHRRRVAALLRRATDVLASLECG
jgi:hypothetical protein